MLIYGVLFIIHWTQISSYLDFYIDTNETKRLLGLEAELYYVRNGSLNTYATQFRVPIKSTLNDMRFTWHSREITKNNDISQAHDQDCSSSHLSYVITFMGMDPEVLQTPVVSIPMQGVVPTNSQTFSIVVGCVPDVTAEIDFDIMFNITSCDVREATYLKLLRKKICVTTDEAFGRLNHDEILIMKKKMHDVDELSDDVDAAATRRRGAAIISPDPSLSPGPNAPYSPQTPAMGRSLTPTGATNSFGILMIGSALAVALLAASGIAAYYHRFSPTPPPPPKMTVATPAPAADPHQRFHREQQQPQQQQQLSSSIDRSLPPPTTSSACTSAHLSSDYQRNHGPYTATRNGPKSGASSREQLAAARKSVSLEAGGNHYTIRSSGRRAECCVPSSATAPTARARALVHRDSSVGENDSHTPLLLHRPAHSYHRPTPYHVIAGSHVTDPTPPSFSHSYERAPRGPPSHYHHLSPVPAVGSDGKLSPALDHHQIARGEDSYGPQTAPIQSRYFAFQNIRLGNVMVEGTFGEIRHAFLHDAARKGSSYEMPIIVKMIKSAGLATASQVELMNRESALCAFKDLQHPNVISLIGFSHMANETGGSVPDQSTSVLIYPHMAHGILKLFLLRCHHSETHIHHLSTKDMVNIAVQILYGLQALHCNGLVHKDLATRNVYMTDNLTVKIGDTSLSRDVFPTDYCCLGDNENRPVKWMSLESLFFKSYSFASDIWSFGVTLWELITFAETPYADIDPFEIGSYLQHGFRLPQPQNCPDEIYSIVLSCLASAPEERPHISLIISALLRFQKTLDRFI